MSRIIFVFAVFVDEPAKPALVAVVAAPANPELTDVPAEPAEVAVVAAPAKPAFTAVVAAPAKPALTAEVAVPDHVPVIVPAEKLPELSLKTIDDAVFVETADE